MPKSVTAEPDWLHSFADLDIKPAELLGRPETEQQKCGYFHTLREICQQPTTLLAVGERMLRQTNEIEKILSGVRFLVLTGSGSSEYAGECVRLPLENELRIAVQSLASGIVLTHGGKALHPQRPALMVSFARSGDSPESVGAISLLLETEPEVRHLILTCNPAGKLAEQFRGDPRVHVIVLDERTNDRSLVMTSSFTGLVVAARAIGFLQKPDAYRALVHSLSNAVDQLIQSHFAKLAHIAARKFHRAVFLASGAPFGAAREASLKMLEMTAGRVSTMPETYLGLRHGPMSYIHPDTLVVCFLSSGPTARAYELDLLRELDRKRLGMLKVILGENIPPDVPQQNDVALECQALGEVGDENATIVDAVAGQLLAFFRCIEEGLRPDSPSEAGVISRVVESFRLHDPQRNAT